MTLAASLVAAALAVAAPSQSVDEVADALRSDPVYVDPAAERAISDEEADDLRDRIRESGAPVFVAIVPASVAPTDDAATALPEELATATGLAGDYAVVVGDRFRASGGGAATAAINEARDEGVAAVLARYVELVAGGSPSGAAGQGSEDDGGGGGSSVLPLALLGAGGVGLWAMARNRRRRDEADARREVEADVQRLRAELSVLSEDVLQLEPQITLHPEAGADYDAATQRVRAASAALDYADDPVDLVRVERVVDEARYAMARARAIVRGQEPPALPAELRRPGRHDEPPLDVDERGEVVYAGGGPFYGGGGWFGGGGGLFSGLLLGSMLGGWGGWGWGGHHHDVHGDGGGGWGDGAGGWGDVGGGDFGGGDFGGGDF